MPSPDGPARRSSHQATARLAIDTGPRDSVRHDLIGRAAHGEPALAEDRFALERCLSGESQAIGHWQNIIESAGDIYTETLKFGVHRVGFSWHWKEELAKLEKGLEELRKLPSEATLDVGLRQRILRREADSPDVSSLSINVDRATFATPGKDLTVTAAA